MITSGIDIGSTTSKCILLKDGIEIIGQSLASGGIGTLGPEKAHTEALLAAGIPKADRQFATGYGRRRWAEADGEISELSAHALGCHFLFPPARTVVDIGGQDAKVICLDPQGRMSSFVMNDKCAAGTGRFLEVMAEVLKIDLSALGTLAGQSVSPAAISSTCTVFAESEVISQLANGTAIPDIAAGICRSVAVRTAALVRRAGLRADVFMSGGVSRSPGVREALGEALGVPVKTDPLAQMAGALGAALHAYHTATQ